MSLLRVDGLTKRFGQITAVEDVSFEVVDGEFISILGPSGSGKSTILRMVAGFETPSSGDIRVRDESLVGVPPFERNVNMVFQNLALFPHLNVQDNIGYGLKQKGVSKEERRARTGEVLEMVQLEGYGERDTSQLSGGEQQRVALARALVNEPEILLFDEPLASLDRKLRQHMQVELQRVQKETGTTFLYVTHDQEVALSVSDRMILLNDGTIEQIGTAEELYASPASRFVAEFIGDANVASGEIQEARESSVDLAIDETIVTVPADTVSASQSPGTPIDHCVRPSTIEVREPEDPSTDDGTPGTAKGVTGRIANRIFKGDGVEYIVDSEIGTVEAHTDDDRFQIDDDVSLHWTDGINVFERRD